MKTPEMSAFARCSALLVGLAYLAHSPQAVKFAGRTAPGDATVPATVTPAPVAAEQLLEGVAPEQERAIRSEVESAVKNATQEGARLLKDAANEATSKWVNEVDLVALQGRQQVEQSVAADLAKVRTKVKTVESEELKVVNKMDHDIQIAEMLVETQVKKSAEKAARSQILNKNAQTVAGELGQIETEEGQMERGRSTALARAGAALEAARELESVAQKADHISQDLSNSGPRAVAGQLLHDVNTSLAQARHANTLANMSAQAAEQEEERVKFSETESLQIKAMSQKLLDAAIQQEALIDGLERRVSTAGLANEVHDAMS
eukprot:TRINITY_DN22919_c0_g1_i1.p1 TRINITY_DN22919_c0_g1~~TRINITY_DN22919_c0_g1_i1.p1  ORF type:complete len:320 (+),score=66.27 TRINITY_DN22919_c0_g1_i1:51-1010(+)